MRVPMFFLIFVSASVACGQSNVAKILEEGVKDAAVVLAPVSAGERKEVLTAAATLLSKHVNFRPDGTAASTYHAASPWPVEWKKLVVRSITVQPVSDADRLNGVTRRYHASISCAACRDWRPGSTAWSEWRKSGFLYFPSGVMIEEKNGMLHASGNAELPKFAPGPGPSIMEKQLPGTRSDLPPGMTRIK